LVFNLRILNSVGYPARSDFSAQPRSLGFAIRV